MTLGKIVSVPLGHPLSQPLFAANPCWRLRVTNCRNVGYGQILLSFPWASLANYSERPIRIQSPTCDRTLLDDQRQRQGVAEVQVRVQVPSAFSVA
jgi:hypothetical protein